MSPLITTFGGPGHSIDRSADGRPVKRPRKDSVTEAHQDQFIATGSNSSQDHVFISETLTSKKPGGKKVG